MTNEIVDRILHDSEYDVSREDSIREIVKEPFRKQHRGVMFLAAFFIVVFLGLSIWVGALFFNAEETWHMILYATLFNVWMLCLGATRLFIWQTIHRGHLQRDVRRLERRVIELTGVLTKHSDLGSASSS